MQQQDNHSVHLVSDSVGESHDAMSTSTERSETVRVNFEFEGLSPVEGMDRIYTEYAKTFGRYPDAFMAQVVEQTKQDLFMWWGAHRERIHAALVAAAVVTNPIEADPK